MGDDRFTSIVTSYEVREGEAWIQLEGELDSDTCKYVVPVLRQAGHDAETVVVDLSGVVFVASLGMAILIKSHVELCDQGKRLMLHGIRPYIRKNFEVVGVLKTIPEWDGPSHDQASSD